MGKEILKKFGRYFLLDLIAQGGMAEIYRARFASSDGAGRFIVIKRIQAGYGANSEFLQMFKSEIKVMLGFNHPNIVQLYDFGEEQKQPYIAMELVDGRNLRQLITRSTERKASLPIELAAFMIEQAAAGLHYAHTFKDKISGDSLNIIHRDVSPQNILISYDGAVKVIDFGIAKATTNSEATRAGVIKGKPSYLSPEQITGEALDGRSDVFSLGAVLWELLAGKKLFAGENDLAILKLIESCQTYVKPPSTINPKVPKELDYIVLRSLTKQREKRFQNAEEFQRALRKFLNSFSPDFTSNDLTYFLKDMFKEEIVEDRKRLQQLNQSAETLLSSVHSVYESEPSDVEVPRSKDDAETMTMKSQLSKMASTGARELESERGKSGIVIDDASGQITRGNVPQAQNNTRFSHSSNNVRRPIEPLRPVAPTQTTEVKGKTKGSTVFLALGAAAVLLTMVLPELGIKLPFGQSGSSGMESGTLVVEGEWKDASVTLNGQLVGRGLPLTVKKVPAGKPYKLVVKGPVEPFEKDIVLGSGENKIVSIPSSSAAVAVNEKRVPAGSQVLLRFNIFPNGSSGSILLNGKALDINSPQSVVPMDAPLELVIERPGYTPFRREFVVSSQEVGSNREQSMDIQLQPLSAGRLQLRSSPQADATIMIDGKPWVRKTPIIDEVLPSGTYQVKLRNLVLGMKKDLTITIEQDKILKLEVTLDME